MPSCAAPIEGDLHLWFALRHSFGKVARCLSEAGMSHQVADNGRSVVVHLPFGNFPQLADRLDDVLSHEEKMATRALLVPPGQSPEYDDLGRIAPLGRLMARSSAGWLLEILQGMRLTAHSQSIVHADDPGRRFAREGLLRGLDRNGALYAPRRMFEVARDAGLLFQLDLAARRTVIGELDRHRITDERTFINVTPTSIYDPSHCLRSTVVAIDDAGIPHQNIIFEVVEAEHTDNPDHLRDILAFCRAEGFGVALDDIGSGSSGLSLIHRLRPDYIKLDMELVRDVDRDDYKAAIAGRLLETAGELGVKSIAKGVETPDELAWLGQHGVDYVQGYLIDQPGPLSE